MQTASGISFRVSPPGYELSWHCAPRRQYSISLSGQVEIEVGDGTKARVGPGDIVLAEDLTGQGHITRVVGHGAECAATLNPTLVIDHEHAGGWRRRRRASGQE